MANGDGAVKSAERVASLLELLGEHRTPMRLIEIAQALEIPRSSAHGLLQTLMAKELVVRDEAQRYRIGIKLFSLAAAAVDLLDIRELARPVMETLCLRTGATCNLAVLDGHDVLYIEKVEDRSSPVRLVTHVGARLPAHVTSLGKVLVGELPLAERNAWLSSHRFDKMTHRTRTNASAFTEDLDAYAVNGFAVDNQEFHEAITGIAAPVRDHTKATVASLSLTLLGRPLHGEAGDEELISAVRESAETISGALQGSQQQGSVQD